MDEKKYVEIRFRLPVVDFKIYQTEAEDNVMPSATAQIRAEVMKQAKIKRLGLINKEERRKQPSVMDVFDDIKI